MRTALASIAGVLLAATSPACAQDSKTHQTLRFWMEGAPQFLRTDQGNLAGFSYYVPASRGCQTVVRQQVSYEDISSGGVFPYHIRWNGVSSVEMSAGKVVLTGPGVSVEKRVEILLPEHAAQPVYQSAMALKAACAGKPDEPSIFDRKSQIVDVTTRLAGSRDACRFVYEHRLEIDTFGGGKATYILTMPAPGGENHQLVMETRNTEFTDADLRIYLRFPASALSAVRPNDDDDETQVQGVLRTSSGASLRVRGYWNKSIFVVEMRGLSLAGLLGGSWVTYTLTIPDPGGRQITATFVRKSDPREYLRATGLRCPEPGRL